MDTLIFALTFAALCFLVFLLLKPLDRRIRLAGALLCAVYLGLDDLVTGLASLSADWALIDAGDWNWSGKVYSLLLAVVVMLALRIRPQAAGLTLRQRNLSSSLVALGLFGVWGFSLGLVFDPSPPSAETLAFQATMPGLSEELAYRGIAPVLLLGLVRERKMPAGIPWAVVVATAVVFGLWHGLGYGDGSFSFDWMSALFPFVGSLAGGWLRFSSGSLLFPVLAHGLANVLFHLAPAIV